MDCKLNATETLAILTMHHKKDNKIFVATLQVKKVTSNWREVYLQQTTVEQCENLTTNYIKTVVSGECGKIEKPHNA